VALGRVALLVMFALLAAACSRKQIVVGSQCPSPYGKNASYAAGVARGAALYGTSCPPCTASRIKLDKRGCPIYVTFDSCGGDICLGDQRLERPLDAGLGADAAREADAARAGEDAGKEQQQEDAGGL
jgi:hypothetical protein